MAVVTLLSRRESRFDRSSNHASSDLFIQCTSLMIYAAKHGSTPCPISTPDQVSTALCSSAFPLVSFTTNDGYPVMTSIVMMMSIAFDWMSRFQNNWCLKRKTSLFHCSTSFCCSCETWAWCFLGNFFVFFFFSMIPRKEKESIYLETNQSRLNERKKTRLFFKKLYTIDSMWWSILFPTSHVKDDDRTDRKTDSFCFSSRQSFSSSPVLLFLDFDSTCHRWICNLKRSLLG